MTASPTLRGSLPSGAEFCFFSSLAGFARKMYFGVLGAGRWLPCDRLPWCCRRPVPFGTGKCGVVDVIDGC